MRDSDAGAFAQLMARMGAVFGKKSADLDGMIPMYFRALARFDYVEVVRGADVLLASEEHFPRPAVWADAIAKAPKGDPLQSMDPREAAEWLDAERRRWENEPCWCAECRAADVTEKPLRFVPTLQASGETQKRLLGSREVSRGHWAHGDELRRWYQARADCYEMLARLKMGHPIRDLMEAL